MATITVEPTQGNIVVSEAGQNDAAAKLDPLPPLTAARYLVVASDSVEGLRRAETPLVEGIRPHAESTLVALEAGFGTAVDDEDEPPAKRLAAALGVTVVAPEGRFLSCDGALFAIGADNGWVAYAPRGAKVVHGKRYPEPSWQAQLPSRIDGAIQIPAGLWLTADADASHAVHLADIAVHPQQLLIVVGSPEGPAPEFTRLRDLLRALPDQTRASAVLIGYGEANLEIETIRLLAAELQEPLRIAHGVTMAGEFVRLDRAREHPTGTFAKESVCTPDGAFELDRWLAPLGMTTVSRNTYRLTRDWLVDVVPAGLVVRPAHQPSGGEGDSLPIMAEVLSVMLCGDRVKDLKRVVGPLRMLLGRLRGFAPTQLIPGDRAARRLIRNAFPGVWAPTARLALTEEGRIIAAAVDENELPVVDEQHPDSSESSEQTGKQNLVDGARDLFASSEPLLLGEADGGHDNVSKATSATDVKGVPRSVQGESSSTLSSASAPHEPIIGVPTTPAVLSDTYPTTAVKAEEQPSPVENVSSRPQPQSQSPNTGNVGVIGRTEAQGVADVVRPQPGGLAHTSAHGPSDALARALRGSAATADLLANSTSRSAVFDAADAVTGAAGRGDAELSLSEAETEPSGRGSVSPQRLARSDTEESVSGPVDADAGATDESGAVATPAPTADIEETATSALNPAEELVETTEIDVPRVAHSTPEQRHRVRSALGARYDVASRSVSQLLAQQPGMRVSSADRSTLLTTLSVVSVFAEDPTARYDIDFHTCLAEGLAALPTTRSIVVRGLSETSTSSKNLMMYSRTPFISAPIDGPLTGPMEALIWTTSGRRLDRLMAGTDAATDVILPAHTHLRVLGTADGPVPRLLLVEDGVNDDNVLTRLHDAAASRDNDPMAARDSRWLGELLAVG